MITILPARRTSVVFRSQRPIMPLAFMKVSIADFQKHILGQKGRQATGKQLLKAKVG